MTHLKMVLHRRHSIAHLAKGHIFICRTLVFQVQMYVPVIAGAGLHAPENVTGVLSQVLLNKCAGFQFQGGQIAECTQLCRQMEQHKVTRDIGICQELPEYGVVGVGVLFFSSSGLILKNDPDMLSQPGKS